MLPVCLRPISASVKFLTLQSDATQLQGDLTGCRTGNGEKLSNSQAEPAQAIKSAVA